MDFRRTLVGAALGLLPLLGGCSLNIDGKQSALDPQGPIAANQYDIFMVTLYVTGFLFVTVGGALAWTVWRFRERKGDDPSFIPPQSHGHPLVEVGLVGVSALLLVIIAIPTFGGILLKERPPVREGEEAITVNVTGYQWWWSFEYPDYGFYTANEIVFPAGTVVKLNLRTDDVIHSFWLPKLAGKTDLMAGQENRMWIQADQPGYFWGQCAEYCGDSHAYMLFRAKALSREEWEEWLARQQRKTVTADYRPVMPVEQMADSAKVMRGAELFVQNCARCHSVDPAVQTSGPNLAHFGSRSSIAAGWFENEPELLARWIKDPDSIKPGNYMWKGFWTYDRTAKEQVLLMEGLDHANLGDDDVDALVEYLYTLK